MQNKNNVEKQRRFDRATVILELENDRRTVETSFFLTLTFIVNSVLKNLLILKQKYIIKSKGKHLDQRNKE